VSRAARGLALGLGAACLAIACSRLIVPALIPSTLAPLDPDPGEPTNSGRPNLRLRALAPVTAPTLVITDTGDESSQGASHSPRRPRREGRSEAASEGSLDASPSLDGDSSKVIKRLGPGSFWVSRQWIDSVVESGVGGARADPFVENGKVIGFQLHGGALGRIGIRSGEVLISVNGVPIDSPDVALAAYSTFRKASDIHVRLKSGSSSRSLRYRIE